MHACFTENFGLGHICCWTSWTTWSNFNFPSFLFTKPLKKNCTVGNVGKLRYTAFWGGHPGCTSVSAGVWARLLPGNGWSLVARLVKLNYDSVQSMAPTSSKYNSKFTLGRAWKWPMGLKTMAAPKKTAGNIWGLKAIFQSFVTQLSASISSTENSMVNPTSSKFNSEFNSEINAKQPFSFQVTTLQQDKTNTNF